jgi:hypothetical protein
MEAAHYRELIRPLIADRRLVLYGHLLNAASLFKSLCKLRAELCLVWPKAAALAAHRTRTAASESP